MKPTCEDSFFVVSCNQDLKDKFEVILKKNRSKYFDNLEQRTQELNKKYNIDITPYQISVFGDYLTVNKHHGKPLPKNMSPQEIEELDNLATQLYFYKFFKEHIIVVTFCLFVVGHFFFKLIILTEL